MYAINLLLGYSSSAEPLPPPNTPRSRALLLRGVIEDVANLLNARPANPRGVLGGDCASILDYGIPDLSHYKPSSSRDQAAVCDLVRRALEAFEPRLMNLSVVPVGVAEDEYTTFRLQIKGRIRLGAEQIAIVIDSKLSAGGRGAALAATEA